MTALLDTSPAAVAADGARPESDPTSLPEEVLSTYEVMPVSLAGHVAGVGIVTLLYWAAAPVAAMVGWVGAFLVVVLVRLAVIYQFGRAVKATREDWLRWRLYSNIGTVIVGVLWGSTAWLFYTRGGGIQQTGLIIIVYTFCVAAVPILSIQPRMYLAFVALCFLPMALRVATVGDPYGYQLAGELLLIISMTILLSNAYRQALRRVIELKRQTDGLLAALRVEKQAADAARQQAEVANRAKTQFFTAASHDLRQPLHAMGLFAEALRQRTREPEVAHLVNSINESVDALEGLFSELLDITRIDAGGVEVEPQHFAFADLLRKLRLHFEPTAFEKGLALRLRGGARVLHADPLLVERIVRNLVSNAIRYTTDGSVLVSCRQRDGRALLQVWDTGPGIAPEQQARIFEEFYQVPGAVVTAPHERKGLGLGLAIVKRLAALMEAPLSMRSVPGKGTVFTLELPLGKVPRREALSPASKGPVGLTLAGRMIVVVEDEPAVRAGLEVLLQGWGAQIVAFDSVAAVKAWAAASDPASVHPDLLIVDYRLEPGTTGIDALVALRQRFSRGIPAIVVSGSTMSGFEREAQEHDFHLLIKPVLPNKLRAMIAFKLGVKAGG